MSPQLNPCPDCGAAFAPSDGDRHAYLGASPECWTAFNTVLAREFEDAAYFSVHRLTVDAYTTQHPGDQSDRRAAQSTNIHLTALYLIFEEGRSFSYASKSLGALAKAYKQEFQPLEPPDPSAYAYTIKDICDATNAEEHQERVRLWAHDVFRAWAPHHETAKRYARRREQL